MNTHYDRNPYYAGHAMPAALRALVIAVAVMGSLFLPQKSACAMVYRLTISPGGNGGVDCVDTTEGCVNGFIVGMHPAIIVSILPIGRKVDSTDYVGIPDTTWPIGMNISAGYYLQSDTNFVADSDLLRQLKLQYYTDSFQATWDRRWRETGKVPHGEDLLAPQFCFRYYLPEALGGKRICFQVTYASTRYGDLRPGKSACVRVFRPCSATDSERVRWDYADYWHALRDWPRLLTVTDSLATLGTTGVIMLGRASSAAERLGQYDRAVAYLDTCFARFGTFTPGLGGAPGSNGPADSLLYKRRREELIQAKSTTGQHPR